MKPFHLQTWKYFRGEYHQQRPGFRIRHDLAEHDRRGHFIEYGMLIVTDEQVAEGLIPVKTILDMIKRMFENQLVADTWLVQQDINHSHHQFVMCWECALKAMSRFDWVMHTLGNRRIQQPPNHQIPFHRPIPVPWPNEMVCTCCLQNLPESERRNPNPLYCVTHDGRICAECAQELPFH